MGFLERLSRSLRGKNGSQVATPEERRSFSPSRLPPSSPLGIVPVATTAPVGARVSGAPFGVAAVAVVAQRDVYPSTDAPLECRAEPACEELSDNEFDEHLTDVFDSLVGQEATPEGQTASADVFTHDHSAAENLFADIAANYARPIKNFIFELKRGTASKEWVEICRPAMRGITKAAQGMGLTLAAKRMVDFESALSLAQKSDSQVLSGSLRNLLLWCYEDLVKVMPQAFVVGEEEQHREGIIINSLLLQIPDVGRVTIDKMYRAGLTSLDTLYLAQPNELAATAGISSELSESICAKFQDYQASVLNSSTESAGLGQRARLAIMLAELRRDHACFQRASQKEWSNPALTSEKREYRQRRQSGILGINVLLAEVGEVDLINELEKLSPERRIKRLEEYLASSPAALEHGATIESNIATPTERVN